MSTISDTNTNLVCLLSATALMYTFHHAYKFDGCRCLIPRKKEWFRAVLTWMLVMCELGMLIWGAGWAYVKYHLGWMYIPSKGTMPVPTQLYNEHYRSFNTPLTIWVCISFSLQVSLNAEEGLYWYHLLRALHRPRTGKSWFRSPFFFTWLGISMITPIAIICTGWIGYEGMDSQMGRMFVAGGAIEALVCLAASTVVFKFPQFLKDVKLSGAGPEVRSRLHFYHQANKVRTFFRALFTTCILILGIDALTEAKKINLNHIAGDLLHQISFGSYFFANIISVMVYLPRDYNTTPHPCQNVMVGRPPPRSPFGYTSPSPNQRRSHTLMSLLREGGQWDEDDDLRLALSKGAARSPDSDSDKGVNFGSGVDDAGPDEVEVDGRRIRRLTPLQNWTTPFGMLSTKIKVRSTPREEYEPDSVSDYAVRSPMVGTLFPTQTPGIDFSRA
ncbi:uncharacterized protein I303_101824 [Kwoniella dejecticola CBS 10117]|uniref:Uncharacterized protein n=1 Tax=Kwoniella dejecticola CBS 10117 TaxID=1296121 RepID=A0A1A6ACP3_9TREE|nr:uncharacterized protein I303_02040 [Kwoniella dejecticola CBS 10117]OBR87826.1 hypothetical protein I303_02040 [Kwoniella dejecticola CBS 10117]